MFDFSAAGPLCGMVASLVAVVVGSQLTISADPATLPSMPLEILRQSSLAGGLLDAIIGNGVLSIPDGALGTSAVSTMTIPLHPVAVAGFIGLIVNALMLVYCRLVVSVANLYSFAVSIFLDYSDSSKTSFQQRTGAEWLKRCLGGGQSCLLEISSC